VLLDKTAPRRWQSANVPDVRRSVKGDPMRFGHCIDHSPAAHEVPIQNASSATSINALSVDSTTRRRAASSGSTVWVKKWATAALPS